MSWNTMIPKEQEQILCAAIWCKDLERKFGNPHHPINIDKGIVFCGFRHGHVIAQINEALGISLGKTGEYIQGFLTSKNRFIDRKEAHSLFVSNGFTPEFKDELYSEDLY